MFKPTTCLILIPCGGSDHLDFIQFAVPLVKMMAKLSKRRGNAAALLRYKINSDNKHFPRFRPRGLWFSHVYLLEAFLQVFYPVV